MKKKYIIFILLSIFALTLAGTLFACGGSDLLGRTVESDEQTAQQSEETDGNNRTDPEENATMIAVPTEETTLTETNTSAEAKSNVEESVEKEAESLITYIQADTDGLNVRKGAGTKYASYGTLDKGDVVLFAGEEGDFYRTIYCGKEAYVSKRYSHSMQMQKTDEMIEKVIAEGVRLLGAPYVYGAVRLHDGNGRFYTNFDENKFDCSSLIQYIFYKGANVLLQVNTRTQVYQGEGVERKELQRGDLLFFTNASRKNETGIDRIGHVGLYLGDGYMLHTASDHAVIEKISALRWSYFITGRRIL